MRTKKALYSMITNILLQFVVIVYGFIIPRVIIGNYGSEVNGLLSSITQFLNYISLMEAGFGGVVIYLLYKPIAKKDNKTISSILATSKRFFNKVSLIFIIYIGILCVLYPQIVNSNFDSVFTVSLILISAISIFSEYFFGLTYKVFLFADQKKYVVNVFSIIVYALNIVAIVILGKLNVPVQALKLVSTLLFAIRPILQNIYVRKKYAINLKDGANKNYKIEQKWDALAQHIASVVHTSTDVTVLTLFCNIAEVSVYSVYYLVTAGIHKIVAIFYDSLSSGFGDMIAKDEGKRLNKVFNSAESFYFIVLSIIFSCAIALITPFVKVYTSGVNDVDYFRPLFGYLIVIAELWSCIRFPYSSISLAAGHYKETRNGAIAECIINILISVVLVSQYGIIGVAIGTIVAMFVRTCEFLYHSNKYILKRNIWLSIKKIIILTLEIVLLVLMANALNLSSPDSVIELLVNTIVLVCISSLLSLTISIIFYRNDIKDIVLILKNIKARKAKKDE